MTPPLSIDAVSPRPVPPFDPARMGRMSHYCGEEEERCQEMARRRKRDGGRRDDYRRPRLAAWLRMNRYSDRT